MLVDGGATLAEDHTIAAIGGAADAGEDDALVKPEPIGLTWTMVKVVKERRVAVLQVSMLGRRIVLHHTGAELSGQKNRRSADLDAGAAVSDSPSGGQHVAALEKTDADSVLRSILFGSRTLDRGCGLSEFLELLAPPVMNERGGGRNGGRSGGRNGGRGVGDEGGAEEDASSNVGRITMLYEGEAQESFIRHLFAAGSFRTVGLARATRRREQRQWGYSWGRHRRYWRE